MFSNIESPVSQMLDYIQKSVSPYHAIQAAKDILSAVGYIELNECDEWQLQKGGRY